jgi:large subunit ribosomal protein L25
MHENAPLLQAKTRDKVGSRYTTRIREAGGLPAVVYGRGKEPVSITLDSREALAHINKGEKVFRLEMAGAKSENQMVLLKELQFGYLGNTIVHADFSRVSLSDRVVVKVPVHLIGEAKGLKQAGAILMHPTSELEIECMVSEIPEHVEVQIGELDVDHAVTAAQVKLPTESMKLKTDSHAIVAQVLIQKEEVVAPTAEAGTVEGAAKSEPEVITAKKKEEEGADAAAKPGDKKAAAPAKDAKPAAPKK